MSRLKGSILTEEHKRKKSESMLKRKERLGYINSLETRKKISKALIGKKHTKEIIEKMKGRIPWNKGGFYSEETKQKISDANRGRKLSIDQKMRISLAKKGKMPKFITSHKGYKHTEKTKKIISEKLEGRPIPELVRKKMSESKRCEKHWNWKGGITPENLRIRLRIEFRLWRESVFARDNWTCQKCNTKGGELHPHHIQNFAQFLELRFAIDNGITFCVSCHKQFHKIYGIKNNNYQQVIEFINGK